jgi:type IV pilus assembly protein PilN
MIRINLLPGQRRKKAVKFDNRFLPGIVFGMVAVIVMVVLFVHLNNRISSLQSEKAVKEQKLAALKVKLKEVENYERDNETFRRKTAIIEQLKSRQGLPVRLLDQVSELLPKGVWLTLLSDKGGAVKLEGFAFTNPDLVNYIQNLKDSEYIADVLLHESKQTNVNNFEIYKFRLTFRMKV